jgi:hypothetical protein
MVMGRLPTVTKRQISVTFEAAHHHQTVISGDQWRIPDTNGDNR